MELTNNTFRNQIKYLYQVALFVFKNQNINETLLYAQIFRGLKDSTYDPAFFESFGLKLSEELRLQAILSQGCAEAVMLMDLYMALNKKICLGSASKNDEKIINRIITCVSKENSERQYESLFIDPKVEAQLVKSSLDFLEMSAYDKILSFKCLDEDDYRVLTSITPLFQEEKIKYDVIIDRNFLIKHINRWKKQFTEEEAINAASKFLIEAFKMNVESEELIIDIRNHVGTDEFMQALLDEDICALSTFILSYYNEYNQSAPKLR